MREITWKLSIDQTIKWIESFRHLTWRRLFSKLSSVNSPVSTLAIVTEVGNRIAQTEMTKPTLKFKNKKKTKKSCKVEKRGHNKLANHRGRMAMTHQTTFGDKRLYRRSPQITDQQLLGIN